jgi:hypothetical protein
MTTLKVEDHHILTFTKNTELLLQQQDSRLGGAVMTQSYTGKAAQAVIQYGDVSMQPITAGQAAGQWAGDTVWSDIGHHQRWILPQDFAVSLIVTHQDVIRMLVDPQSGYAQAVAAANNRKVDELISLAAIGVSQTGDVATPVNVALPADQVIVDGGDGLTIKKLIAAREKLDAAENNPNEQRFICVSAKQISDMLENTEVQSADYNTVKALVQGEVDTFLGFKFIRYEGLTSTPSGADTIRHAFAWVKSGVYLGTWDSFMVRVEERPDKNYVRQLYARRTLGATRTQEKKVVQINCLEAA